MMGELDTDLRYGLISALVHLVNKEFGEVGRDLIQLQVRGGGVEFGCAQGKQGLAYA